MAEHEMALRLIGLAEEVKAKSFNVSDILSNSKDIINRLRILKKFYREALLIDLDYALHVKVDEDLWEHGFANYIEPLHERVKRTTCLPDPEQIEMKVLLSAALAEANMFYFSLLEEFRVTFDLGHELRHGMNPFMGQIAKRTIVYRPKMSSLLHMGMKMYIHLGDIARYCGNFVQATVFYSFAMTVNPVSPMYGPIFNQIGLAKLEGNLGWDYLLSAVDSFMRGSAVPNPSQAAISNLSRLLAKCAKDTTKINKYVDKNQDGIKKRKVLTPQECLALFLKVHGLIYIGSKDLAACEKIVPCLIKSWEAWATERAKESHGETDDFCTEGSEFFRKVFDVNLFALHQIQEKSKSKADVSKDTADAAQIDDADQCAKAIILDLMAGSLHAVLQSFPRNQGDGVPHYFAFPFIKIVLDWIRSQPDIMTEPAFTSRPQIWTNLCAIFRALQNRVSNPDLVLNLYSFIPLLEDRVLEGFVPFMAAMSDKFEFNSRKFNEASFRDLLRRCNTMFPLRHGSGSLEDIAMCVLRSCRLLQHRLWLAQKEELGFRTEPNGELAFVVGATTKPASACSDQDPVAGAKSKNQKNK